VPQLQLDHVAVALRSIKSALPLYRDALGGEYLMGGDVDGSWRWIQLRFPGGGKVELLEPLEEGFLTRFLERIQQFEKQLKKRGQLDKADAEALVVAILLLAQALQPFAPHAAEGILINSGRFTSADLPGAWPDAAAIPVAVDDAMAGAAS